jgi:hypothetical protein
LAYLEDPASPRDEQSYRWVVENVFGLDELRALLRRHLRAYAPPVSGLPEVLARVVSELERNGELSPPLEDELDAWFEARSLALRCADRHYWRSIIDELGRLRQGGRLMVEGAPV